MINRLQEKKYSKSLQMDLITAVENRRDKMLALRLMDLFSYKETYPEWIKRWLSGESFFLDLSHVPQDIQRFIVCSLLNLIQFKPEIAETSELQNFILIDEAHRLVGSPPSRLHPNDDEMVTINLQLENMANFFNEFRFQGISLAVSDQRIDRVEYASNVGLKIYFHSRTAYSVNETLSEENLEYISHLKSREILVCKDEDEAVLHTPDYFVEENSQKHDDFKIDYDRIIMKLRCGKK
jgi:hypothetical protein